MKTENKSNDTAANSGVDSSDLLEYMRNESNEFRVCAKIHTSKGNMSTAAVANRAKEVIDRFIFQITSNVEVEHE